MIAGILIMVWGAMIVLVGGLFRSRSLAYGGLALVGAGVGFFLGACS